MTTGLELWPNSSQDEIQTIIRAVYRYVLGNPHVMDSERLTQAESQLADGSISVREFVRAVAQSEFYRNRYFATSAPYRFVELNFMHLLGRPPQSQAEISVHVVRVVTQGYETEINSYIDSDEYQAAFGENVVPYNRSAQSTVGLSQVTYNRGFALDRGFSQVSSSVKSSQLVAQVAANAANRIAPARVNLSGSGEANKKQFKIVVQGSAFDGPRRLSNTTYLVSGDNMTPQLQRIHRNSGKIVSITEVI